MELTELKRFLSLEQLLNQKESLLSSIELD